MRQTKYITSGGLAFAEDKDMEKLRSYSLSGWHVRNFQFMGYMLEKGERAEYIYSVDYRLLKDNEEEEYFDLFSTAGWSHITSEGDIHLFRAHPGTKPIYTDRDTIVDKHKSSIVAMKKFAIPLFSLTVISWIGALLSSGNLESFLLLLAVILSIIAMPIAWTVATTYSNKWEVEGRRGLVNLVKIMPFLLLLVTLGFVLFVIEGTGTIGTLLLYMLVGAIALPTAIWMIMSLYLKVR